MISKTKIDLSTSRYGNWLERIGDCLTIYSLIKLCQKYRTGDRAPKNSRIVRRHSFLTCCVLNEDRRTQVTWPTVWRSDKKLPEIRRPTVNESASCCIKTVYQRPCWQTLSSFIIYMKYNYKKIWQAKATQKRINKRTLLEFTVVFLNWLLFNKSSNGSQHQPSIIALKKPKIIK